MGSETEYTTAITGSLDRRVDPDKVLHYEDPDNLWLKNGARLYIDHGRVIEYATPECSSGFEVMLQERVGEHVVRELGDIVIREIDPEFADLMESEPRTPVYKRTGYADVRKTDEPSTSLMSPNLSTGHHETYQTTLTRSQLESGNGYHLLNAYLSTRIVWSGTGLVSTLGYELSQKAPGINFSGSSPTRHGDKMPYRFKGDGLLEIRLGEGNMSDWAIATKFDMTSLVLRMMEHGISLRNVDLRNKQENVAFRTASTNPLAMIPTESGRLDAIDIQCMIAEEAILFGEKHGAPRHEIQAAENVLKACYDVQAFLTHQDSIDTVSDRIDWAAKLHKLYSRGIGLGQISCANLIAVAYDLSWEDLSPHGSARRWYAKHQPDRVTEPKIKRTFNQPPEGRASSRVALLQEHSGEIRSVEWDYITLTNGNSYPITD